MTVSWEIDDAGVLEVRVNEAHRHNRFSEQTITGLRSAFEVARSTPEARCVLVVTEGDKVFMAGADLETVLNGGDEITRLDLFGLFEELEQLPIPVVCAVQGLALGGGFEFIICADLVVASEEAQFGLPETGIGLAPGIAMIRLHHEIGRHLAKELAFTPRRLSAQEAAALGLVNRVVPRDRVASEARAMAAAVAARAPIAVKVTKRGFNREWEGADWSFVRNSMSIVFHSSDCEEGVRAFKERRSPHFTGE